MHDTPANLSTDRCCVGTQIGIVGRLVGHACHPASPAKRNDDGKTDPSDNHRCAGKTEIGPAAGLSCCFEGLRLVLDRSWLLKENNWLVHNTQFLS